jgi:hypothetical protein
MLMPAYMYQENREIFPSNWLYYRTCEILLILACSYEFMQNLKEKQGIYNFLSLGLKDIKIKNC